MHSSPLPPCLIWNTESREGKRNDDWQPLHLTKGHTLVDVVKAAFTDPKVAPSRPEGYLYVDLASLNQSMHELVAPHLSTVATGLHTTRYYKPAPWLVEAWGVFQLGSPPVKAALHFNWISVHGVWSDHFKVSRLVVALNPRP